MTARNMLQKEWGEGWISTNGRDLAKIAVNLAGFDAQDLTMRLLHVRTKGDKLNAATVERVIADMERERKANTK